MTDYHETVFWFVCQRSMKLLILQFCMVKYIGKYAVLRFDLPDIHVHLYSFELPKIKIFSTYFTYGVI